MKKLKKSPKDGENTPEKAEEKKKRKKGKQNIEGDTLEPSKKTGSVTSGELIDFNDVTDDDEEPRINERYRKAAIGVRLCKFIALTAFLVFFLGMVVIFSQEITVENFRYVIKDLNLEMPATIDEFGEMYYVASSEQKFSVYKNDLVAVGCEMLEITDINGGKVQTTALKYLKPQLLSSDKFILTYDLSGMNFAVFNSFSTVYKETMNYPISCAAINNNGAFLIATRDDKYKTVVYYYGKTTERLYKYCSNEKYIQSMLLCDDGTFFLITSYNKDGTFITEVLKCDYRTEEIKSVAVIKDSYALNAGFTSDNSFVVLCTDRLAFFNFEGLISFYSFNSGSCNGFDASDGITAAFISENVTGGKTELVIFDSDGTPLMYRTEDDNALTLHLLRAKKECVYLVYDGRIERVIPKLQETFVLKTDYDVLDVLTLDDDVLLLATQTRAYPVSITYDFTVKSKTE